MSQQDQADALLEAVAIKHDLLCELRPCDDSGWEVVTFDAAQEQLAAADEALDAVLELQAELEAA